MKRITREWVRKAEDDFRAAEILAAGQRPFHDPVCFHCQQSAEKYLKALLEELSVAISKTHDLEDLLDLLLPHYASLGAATGADCDSLRDLLLIHAIPCCAQPSVRPRPRCAGPTRCATPAATSSASDRRPAPPKRL